MLRFLKRPFNGYIMNNIMNTLNISRQFVITFPGEPSITVPLSQAKTLGNIPGTAPYSSKICGKRCVSLIVEIRKLFG